MFPQLRSVAPRDRIDGEDAVRTGFGLVEGSGSHFRVSIIKRIQQAMLVSGNLTRHTVTGKRRTLRWTACEKGDHIESIKRLLRRCADVCGKRGLSLVWEPILSVELLLVHFVVKEQCSFELNVIVLSYRLNDFWWIKIFLIFIFSILFSQYNNVRYYCWFLSNIWTKGMTRMLVICDKCKKISKYRKVV